jgi:hypothetical protein
MTRNDTKWHEMLSVFEKAQSNLKKRKVAVCYQTFNPFHEMGEPPQHLRQKRPLDDVPGSFASNRLYLTHNNERCLHRFVVPADSFENREDKSTACATAHIVHAVSNSFGRWEGAGTKPGAHISGKVVALQTVIDPELPDGLNQATARALGTKVTMVSYGRDVRTKQRWSLWNQEN